MVSRFEKYHPVAKTTTSYRPTFTQSLNLLLTAAKSQFLIWGYHSQLRDVFID